MYGNNRKRCNPQDADKNNGGYYQNNLFDNNNNDIIDNDNNFCHVQNRRVLGDVGNDNFINNYPDYDNFLSAPKRFKYEFPELQFGQDGGECNENLNYRMTEYDVNSFNNMKKDINQMIPPVIGNEEFNGFNGYNPFFEKRGQENLSSSNYHNMQNGNNMTNINNRDNRYENFYPPADNLSQQVENLHVNENTHPLPMKKFPPMSCIHPLNAFVPQNEPHINNNFTEFRNDNNFVQFPVSNEHNFFIPDQNFEACMYNKSEFENQQDYRNVEQIDSLIGGSNFKTFSPYYLFLSKKMPECFQFIDGELTVIKKPIPTPEELDKLRFYLSPLKPIPSKEFNGTDKLDVLTGMLPYGHRILRASDIQVDITCKMLDFTKNEKNGHICLKRFYLMSDIMNHITECHLAQIYDRFKVHRCCWVNCKCKEGGDLKARYKLVNHIRTHTNEKPFVCGVVDCYESFTRIENLRIHQRSHTKEKPFECQFEGCVKTFANSSDRKKHQNVHSDVQKYLCKFEGCGKAYSHPSSLRKHVKIHNNA